MQRIVMIILAATAMLAAHAQYAVYEVKGKATVDRQGQKKAVTKGMELRPSDVLDLGRGAEVIVTSKLRKKNLTVKGEGRATVLNRMVDANRKAKDNATVVGGFGSKGNKFPKKPQPGNMIYTHDGAANRGGLEICDSDTSYVSDIQLLAAILRNWECYTRQNSIFPAEFRYVTEDGADNLVIENQGDNTIYFNIFRVTDGKGISAETYSSTSPELNNSVGPRAEWTMVWRPQLGDGSRRVVLMSDVPFDLEELLLELQEGDDNVDDSPAVERNKWVKVL